MTRLDARTASCRRRGGAARERENKPAHMNSSRRVPEIDMNCGCSDDGDRRDYIALDVR